MKKYELIGLTGQSGAGKSTVAAMLRARGAYIIDADLLVKKIYLPLSPCVNALSSAFGDDIIRPDGTPDRKLLAQRAFSSQESTSLLNSTVHPFVLSELLKELKAAVNKGETLIVFDAPQLFESNCDVLCDRIISVVADKKTRVKRICERDGITEEQALKRVNAQHSEEFFRQNSDLVIENNSDLQSLENKLADIIV